jgi:hypothetical protein
MTLIAGIIILIALGLSCDDKKGPPPWEWWS